SPLLIAAVLCAGCATERMVPATWPPGERAVVHADPAVSAGLPVQLRLRKVNGRKLPLTASSVELPPGRHGLLVDCRVAATDSVRRFTVDALLEAGRNYRLVATASARNCEAVELVEQ
ncbi:MAG: hypothetical protein ACREB5_10905, partial [Sphingomonadaceae bacterium]